MHLENAASEDRLDVLREKGREVFAPLLEKGLISRNAVGSIINSQFDMWVDDSNGAEIDKIVHAITGSPMAEDDAELWEDDDIEHVDELPKRPTVEPWWQDPSTIVPRKSLDTDRHLYRGSVSASVAAGGRAKTTQAIAEAIRMAAGLDLTTKQPLPAGKLKVWIVNGEEDQVELDRRAAAVCRHYGVTRDDLGGRLFVQSVRNTSLRLASVVRNKPTVEVAVQRFFIDFMQAHGIDVLVIDPLVSFHSLNESDNGHMDLLVKDGFGGIAHGANAACELLHHIGKSRPGLAEATVDDGRGASAIIWACRSARVYNFMTDQEARKLGVAESDRRRHIKIANGKANNGPIGAAKWIKLEVEKLPNGDEVAVASPWTPANRLEGITTDHTKLARELAISGSYREDSRSPDWFGYAIAPHLAIDVSYGGANEPSDRVRLSSIIDKWLDNKVLAIEERKDEKRKLKKFIVAGPINPVDPSAGQDEDDTL